MAARVQRSSSALVCPVSLCLHARLQSARLDLLPPLLLPVCSSVGHLLLCCSASEHSEPGLRCLSTDPFAPGHDDGLPPRLACVAHVTHKVGLELHELSPILSCASTRAPLTAHFRLQPRLSSLSRLSCLSATARLHSRPLQSVGPSQHRRVAKAAPFPGLERAIHAGLWLMSSSSMRKFEAMTCMRASHPRVPVTDALPPSRRTLIECRCSCRPSTGRGIRPVIEMGKHMRRHSRAAFGKMKRRRRCLRRLSPHLYNSCARSARRSQRSRGGQPIRDTRLRSRALLRTSHAP